MKISPVGDPNFTTIFCYCIMHTHLVIADVYPLKLMLLFTSVDTLLCMSTLAKAFLGNLSVTTRTLLANGAIYTHTAVSGNQ